MTKLSLEIKINKRYCTKWLSLSQCLRNSSIKWVFFGHVTRGTRKSIIREQDFELTRRSGSFLLSLYSRPEKSKLFPPFCCMDFSVCSLNAWDSCIAWVFIPDLYCVQLNVFIKSIDLFCFLPNILHLVTLFRIT